MTPLHDLLLVTNYDIDRIGIAKILDNSMRYKVHLLKPNLIAASFFDGLNSTPIGLIDIELHDTDPVLVAMHLSECRPGIPLLFFARGESPELFLRGVRNGIIGTVQKTDSPQALLRKLDLALHKQILWNKEELKRFQACFSLDPCVSRLEMPLTQRESYVLSKLICGMTNRQIADELSISYESVKVLVQHILRKIGVTDRTQAAVWAVRKRLF